jgi:hypothetical protein
MKHTAFDLLLAALRDPAVLPGYSDGAWDQLVRLGRSADLLARLAVTARQAGVWDRLPSAPRRHLSSALKLAQRQRRELDFELEHVADALAENGVPVVLLKGAAYAASGLDASRGRLLSDVDILVPCASLQATEMALMLSGWITTKRDPYDQRYYRTWMHELPPMRHVRRGTTLDVHHALLPLTARLQPGTDRLLARARRLRPGSCLHVLAPHDMVLHSAAHLMHEGEFERGLRGLVDLDALLREFGAQPGFWTGLVPRAVELDLVRPLFYALRYTIGFLQTPVPSALLESLAQAPGAHPGRWGLRLMDAAFRRVLRPVNPLAADRWTPLARAFLYLRGHWLRMPPGLLLLHLSRKALSSRNEPVPA